MEKRRNIGIVVLIIVAVAIKIFSLFPNAVERCYSRRVYPFLSDVQRLLFGWIPFSIGDIFYFILGAFVLIKIIRFIRRIVRRQITKQWSLSALRRVVIFLLIIYVAFNLLWGLNYNRIPIGKQFNLPAIDYSDKELTDLVVLLTDSLNSIDSSGTRHEMLLASKSTIFKRTWNVYMNSGKRFPILYYEDQSIKPSLYSYIMNYSGVTGYYNPFSGEAQVNTTVPGFALPFIACHEVGHQLGYAKEDEANFAGFLAAHQSPIDDFRYSAYFDMYSYARRELYYKDSVLMKSLQAKLRPGVKKDMLTLHQFYKKYENPFEPYITGLYEQYLKANQQPEGMKSYSGVVALLIAYYRYKR